VDEEERSDDTGASQGLCSGALVPQVLFNALAFGGLRAFCGAARYSRAFIAAAALNHREARGSGRARRRPEISAPLHAQPLSTLGKAQLGAPCE
jgi:hypothetical protein